MREMLITLDCIKQIKRGSAKSESEWILVRKPEPADFDTLDPEAEKEKLTNKELRLWRLSVEGQLANIEARLGGLDIVRALNDVQVELAEVKQEIEYLKGSVFNGDRV
jgi:hypothetical protein